MHKNTFLRIKYMFLRRNLDEKIINILIIFAVIMIMLAECYAFSFNNIISQGNSFKDQGASSALGTSLSNSITNDLIPIVKTVGYLIIAVATVILGAKCIWSAADGKAVVKNTLPTFVIGIIFFYLGERIVSALSGEFSATMTYATMEGKIIGTVNNIVRYVSFAGIIFLGIKYMLGSISGKPDIKEHAIPLILGIILVFCATNFVQFIIDAGVEMIP